jgi:8-oxo-dGTP pyrophosphatase MutT (NUDIX family)
MVKKGNQQIAALPIRRGRSGLQVLLITSRETKRWVIPKGWPMDAYADFNAAKIEAYEEAGVRGRVSRKPLGRFRYVKLLKSGEARHMTVTVYSLQVEQLLAQWPEKSERTRKWFSVEEAATLVAETGLQNIIARLKAKR